jgi:hypothetical protein
MTVLIKEKIQSLPSSKGEDLVPPIKNGEDPVPPFRKGGQGGFLIIGIFSIKCYTGLNDRRFSIFLAELPAPKKPEE